MKDGRKYRIWWEDKRPWLRYGVKNDAAFCSYCVIFASTSDSPFVEGGFRSWKKALCGQKGYLDHHASSTDHVNASEKAINFLHTSRNAGTNIHAKISKLPK